MESSTGGFSILGLYIVYVETRVVGKGEKLESLVWNKKERSFKVWAKVGKFGLELVRSNSSKVPGWSSKVPNCCTEITWASTWKESRKLKSCYWSSKFISTFQFQLELSKFRRNLSISLDFFQLNQKLSDFRLSNLRLSHFSVFPTALTTYMCLFIPSNW